MSKNTRAKPEAGNQETGSADGNTSMNPQGTGTGGESSAASSTTPAPEALPLGPTPAAELSSSTRESVNTAADAKIAAREWQVKATNLEAECKVLEERKTGLEKAVKKEQDDLTQKAKEFHNLELAHTNKLEETRKTLKEIEGNVQAKQKTVEDREKAADEKMKSAEVKEGEAGTLKIENDKRETDLEEREGKLVKAQDSIDKQKKELKAAMGKAKEAEEKYQVGLEQLEKDKKDIEANKAEAADTLEKANQKFKDADARALEVSNEKTKYERERAILEADKASFLPKNAALTELQAWIIEQQAKNDGNGTWLQTEMTDFLNAMTMKYIPENVEIPKVKSGESISTQGTDIKTLTSIGEKQFTALAQLNIYSVEALRAIMDTDEAHSVLGGFWQNVRDEFTQMDLAEQKKLDAEKAATQADMIDGLILEIRKFDGYQGLSFNSFWNSKGFTPATGESGLSLEQTDEVIQLLQDQLQELKKNA